MSETPTKITCSECGDVIVGIVPNWKDSKPICRNCAFKFDAEDKVPVPKVKKAVKEPAEPAQTSQGMDPRKRLLGAVLLLSLIVFGASLPRLTSSFIGGKPARIGDVKTDSKCDQCILNLWKISKVLQDTGVPDTTLKCPESGQPYIIKNTGTDMVIMCPSPELHHVKSIQVSRNNPFPEVKP